MPIVDKSLMRCLVHPPGPRTATYDEYLEACEQARGRLPRLPTQDEIEAMLPDLIDRFGATVNSGVLGLDAGIIVSRINRATGIGVAYESVNTHLSIMAALQIEDAQRREEQRVQENKVVENLPDEPGWDTPFPVESCKGQLKSGELQRFIRAHGGFWLRPTKSLHRIAQKRGVPVSKNSITLAIARWRKEHKKGEEP